MDDNAVDLGLLIVRCAIGLVMLLHGLNHIFRGGKIPGTGRWFESLGMKPGVLHAWLASLTEVGAGVLLFAGALHGLACAGVVGVMAVALITNHLKNGFFIFRPGEGYEYVLTLLLVALGLAGAGPGRWSVDHALDLDLGGTTGLVVAAVAGGGGAALLLAVFWRPPAKQAEG